MTTAALFAPSTALRAPSQAATIASRLTLVALWSIAIFGAVSVWQSFSGFIFEDAYITYRYADNISHGRGFVFTEGERVLGTTAPLYTLILAALGWIGADIPAASGVIFVVSSGLTGLLGGLILRRVGSPVLGVAFALFAASGGPEIYRFYGLETPFLCALLIGAVLAALAKRTTLGAVLVGCAFLTRYDAALFAILYFTLTSIRDRKVPVADGLLATAIVLPWLVFAQWYFGSVLPNTLGAKTGDTGFQDYFLGAIQRQWVLSASYLRATGFGGLLGGQLGVWGGTALAVGVAAGLLGSILRREPMALLLLLHPLALLLGYAAIGPNLNFLWYPAPATYCIVLFALLGLAHLVRWLRLRIAVDLALVPVLALGVLAIPPHLAERAGKFTEGSQYRYRIEAYREMASFVRAAGLTDQTLLTHEPGYFAYLSNNPAIDQAGLVTKDIYFHGDRSRRTPLADIVSQGQPGLIVSASGTPPSGYLPIFTKGTRFELTLRRDLYRSMFEGIQRGIAAIHASSVPEMSAPFSFQLNQRDRTRWISLGGIAGRVGTPLELTADGAPYRGPYMYAGPGDFGAESPSFRIDFDTLEFLLAAKPHPRTGAQLIVDGQPVLSAMGHFDKADPKFERVLFDLAPWRGRVACLRFVQWAGPRHAVAFDQVRSGMDAERRLLDDFEDGKGRTLWRTTFPHPAASLHQAALECGGLLLASNHAATSFGLEGAVSQVSGPILIDQNELRFSMLDFGDERTSVTLMVDGEVVCEQRGTGSRATLGIHWDVSAWRGRCATMHVVDGAPPADLWLGVDDLVLATSGMQQQ